MEVTSDLRDVMRRWVAGVVIITSADENQRHGMTVNSFTSVSIAPPMVSFTLSNSARTFAMITKSGLVGVTLLHQGQRDLSERFAGKTGDVDRFSGLSTFTMQTGVPLILGGMATMEAKVIHHFDMPTSTLFIAEVVSMAKEVDMEPLVYFNRAYHRLQNEPNPINP